MKIDTKHVAVPGVAGLLAGALVAGVMPATFAAEAPAKDKEAFALGTITTAVAKAPQTSATAAIQAPAAVADAELPSYNPISVTIELPAPPEPEPVVVPASSTTEEADYSNDEATADSTTTESYAADESTTDATTAEVTDATAAEATFTPAPAASSGVVGIARQYSGAAYVYGASGPSAFDCSGFTSYVFAQVGISLPRSSSAQRYAGVEVSAAEAQPGDLVWWPGHVGIYTGNGNHIAARNPASGVGEGPVYGSPVYIRVG